jgi:hypothetical protein
MTAARGLAAILASGRRLTAQQSGLALRRGSGAAPRRPAPPGDSQMTQDAPRLVSGWGRSRKALKAAYDSPRAVEADYHRPAVSPSAPP